MTDAQIDVPTVHCRACKLNIEEALEEVEGVAASDVDVDAKRVTVTFDDARVDLAAITSAIEAAGYPATSQA
jgi:periplasmic mercuric ion binding protein